jgi:DNA-binding beta-propeller fold protein YncE
MNMVYVVDHGNGRISVFKTTGEFVTVLGAGILKEPECIAIDDNGYIHVTDDRSRIVTF